MKLHPSTLQEEWYKKVSIGYFDIISVVEIMGETFLF